MASGEVTNSPFSPTATKVPLAYRISSNGKTWRGAIRRVQLIPSGELRTTPSPTATNRPLPQATSCRLLDVPAGWPTQVTPFRDEKVAPRFPTVTNVLLA